MAPIATLTVRVSAQIAELQKSFADATKSTQEFQDVFAATATAAASVGTFLGTVFAGLAGKIVSGLGNAVTSAIKYSQQFQNAFLGLSGVAAAFGSSADAATAAAKSLAADGMLPLSDAATGLKNLLSAGFNLKQSTDLMNAFKDSAAFGRQSSLSFGEAVRSATEGVKNQNSVLVDNSGVTKNLSVILKEAGFTMQDLSDKTKGASARQALYTGILHETAAQQGDAAKAAHTYTGAMAALDTAQQSLLATCGDAITRNASVQTALVGVADMFRKLTDASTDNKKAFYLVSDAITFLLRTMGGLLMAVDDVQSGFAKLDSVISGSVVNMLGWINKMAKALLDLLQIATKIPGGSAIVGTLAGQELKDLLIVYGQTSITIKEMNAQMKVTQQRSKDISAALAPTIATVFALADATEKARGQMVDLGESTKPPNLDKGGPAALTKEMLKAQKAFKKVADDIRAFESGAGLVDISKMFNWNKAVQTAKLTVAQINQELKNLPGFESKIPVWDFSKMFDANKAKQQAGLVKAEITQELRDLPTLTHDIWAEMGRDMPRAIADGLRNGQSMILTIAESLGQTFGDAFAKAQKRALDQHRDLTTSEKAIGAIGAGVDIFTGGYAIGASQGKVKGALGGAASGALSGAAAGSAIMPGIGTAVGAVAGGIVGLFGGLFGGSKKAKEDRAALAANKQALLDQYGGMKQLVALADQLHVNIQKAFDAKNADQFTAAVNELNKAIDEEKKKMEALGGAVDALNTRTGVFAAKFQAILDAKPPEGASASDADAFQTQQAGKLAALAQTSGDEFDRLGLIARDTFAGLVKDNGNAIAAMEQMGPTFQVLEDGVDKFGLTASGVTQDLIDNFRLVNDAAFKPLFDQIVADGQILQDLMSAKALSPEGFQALATDIGAGIQGVIDKGGDMARTLALSQPVLQSLWEAQQQYGAITDDTTAKILQQAHDQGLVGDQMKSVNEQILDVLLSIGKVLGADLPDYFSALQTPAKNAADDVTQAFSNIDIPPIDIKYQYVALNDAPAGVTVPQLGSGGIVRRPTLALIGESGPEAVIPLSSGGLGVTPQNYQTDIYLDGDRIARSTAKRMPGVLKGVGVGV